MRNAPTAEERTADGRWTRGVPGNGYLGLGERRDTAAPLVGPAPARGLRRLRTHTSQCPFRTRATDGPVQHQEAVLPSTATAPKSRRQVLILLTRRLYGVY